MGRTSVAEPSTELTPPHQGRQAIKSYQGDTNNCNSSSMSAEATTSTIAGAINESLAYIMHYR